MVAETQAKGDCDPIDAIEIGARIQKRGAVIQVYLCALCDFVYFTFGFPIIAVAYLLR